MAKCETKATQTGLGTFRHNQAYPGIIQAYSGIFKTLCNPGVFRTVVFPEPWHIQNQKHILNSGIFTTLVYSELPYIQNADIFKIAGIFRTLSNIYDEVFCENGYNYFRSISLSRSLLHEINIMRHLPQS